MHYFFVLSTFFLLSHYSGMAAAEQKILSTPIFQADNKPACAKHVAEAVLKEIGIESSQLKFERQGGFLYRAWFQFTVTNPDLTGAKVWIRVNTSPTFNTTFDGKVTEQVQCQRAVLKGTYFTLKGTKTPVSLCDFFDDVLGPMPCF